MSQSNPLSEKARNQSSIDRIENLPTTLGERKNHFDAGLKEIKRQGLLISGINIIPKLDEIRLGRARPYGGYEYKPPMKDPKQALVFLKANPDWFTADGVYKGGGNIEINATATSSETKLAVYRGTLLEMRMQSRPFRLALSNVENVVQTIAHEIGHHKGHTHQDAAIYNNEYMAVRKYRSK